MARAKRKVLIDLKRGLTANAPEYILHHELRGEPLPVLEELGRTAVANDVNKHIHNDQFITSKNVVLARRCSAIFHIVVRYLNHILEETNEGVQFKNLQIKPAYCLFHDATKAVGWKDILTKDFRDKDMKTTTARLNEIRRKLKFNPSTRLMVINSPNNPTGEVYNNSFLRGIVEIMKEYPKLYVLSDVIYEKMADAPTLFKVADASLRDRIFEVNGISKTVMPGDKNSAGYVYTGEKHANEMRKLLAKGSIANENSHVMDAHRLSCLIAGLEMTKPEFFDHMREYYDTRKNTIIKEFEPQLKQLGVTVEPAGELYYLIFNFKNSGLTSDAFVKSMLEKQGIELLPPDKVGFKHNCLRFSLGTGIVDNELAGKFKNDNRNGDFTETYANQYFSSDLNLYRYVMEKAIETIVEMKNERASSAVKRLQGRDSRNDGQAFGQAI